jgi:hypothetical protein
MMGWFFKMYGGLMKGRSYYSPIGQVVKHKLDDRDILIIRSLGCNGQGYLGRYLGIDGDYKEGIFYEQDFKFDWTK